MKQARFLTVGLLAIFCSCLLPFQGAAAGKSKFTKVTLKNGLTVLYQVMKKKPMVSMNVVFPIGMNQEKEKGIAHLFEHLVFRGGGNYTFKEITGVTIKKGGYFNGFTSFNNTAYNYVVPKENFNEALKVFNASVWQTSLTKESVALEKKIVMHELDMDYAQRYQYYPVFRYFYPEFSYSQATVDAITIQNLQDFHRNYYQPENATYVITGDFEPKPILEELAKLKNGFGEEKNSKPLLKEFSLPEKEVVETRNLYPYQYQLLMAYEFQGLTSKEQLILKLLANIYAYDSKIDYQHNEYQIYNAISRTIGKKDFFGIFYLEREQRYSQDEIEKKKASMRKYFREFKQIDFSKEVSNLQDMIELAAAKSQASPESAADYEVQRLVNMDELMVDSLPLLKSLKPKDLEAFCSKYFTQPPKCWILVKTTKPEVR